MRDDDFCPKCGTWIDFTRPHAVKKIFCSPQCQRADYRQMEKEARLQAKQGRICKECRGPIAPEKSAQSIYCSLTCQRKASASLRVGRYPLTCRVCERPFFGHHRHQLYCSNSCKGRMGGIVRRRKAAATQASRG